MSRIFFQYLQIRTAKFCKGLPFIIWDLIGLDFFSSQRNGFFKKKISTQMVRSKKGWGF